MWEQLSWQMDQQIRLHSVKIWVKVEYFNDLGESHKLHNS